MVQQLSYSTYGIPVLLFSNCADLTKIFLAKGVNGVRTV